MIMIRRYRSRWMLPGFVQYSNVGIEKLAEYCPCKIHVNNLLLAGIFPAANPAAMSSQGVYLRENAQRFKKRRPVKMKEEKP